MPMTPERLAEYIARDLDADLARWFPDADRVSIAPTVRPAAPFAARLPADAAEVLLAFDAKVRSGTLASLYRLDLLEDWTYGFDFAAHDITVLDAERETDIAADVWSLATDGAGNHYVLLTNGQVALWICDESGLEEGGAVFEGLDALLWWKVRAAAVNQGMLTWSDVEPELVALQRAGVLLDVECG
jgi:hypothetical protein